MCSRVWNKTTLRGFGWQPRFIVFAFWGMGILNLIYALF